MSNAATLALVVLGATEQFLKWQMAAHTLLRQADAEGRDLTSEELAACRAGTEAAVQAFLAKTGGA